MKLFANRRHCPEFHEAVDFSQPSKIRCTRCQQSIIASVHDAPRWPVPAVVAVFIVLFVVLYLFV